MDHSLRTISYIADIGDILVIMARRRILSSPGEESLQRKKQAKILCHMKIKIKILRIIDLDAFSLKVVMILMQVISTIQTQITYLIRFKYMA
jgi:hypothetical protein